MKDPLFNLKLDLIFDFLAKLPENQVINVWEPGPTIKVKIGFYDGMEGYFNFAKDITAKNFETECLSFEVCNHMGVTALEGYKVPELCVFEINKHYGKEESKETRYEG